MQQVSSTDVQRNFAGICDQAMDEPILITQRGRGRLVMCSHAQFHQMWVAWKRERGELHDVDDATLEKAREGQ